MEWISVNERLPEDDVLLYHATFGYSLGYYSFEDNEFYHTSKYWQPTHWSFLPNPPKE